MMMFSDIISTDKYQNIEWLRDTVFDILHDTTREGNYILPYSGSLHIFQLHKAVDEFIDIKKHFGKTCGKQVKHFVLTLENDEVSNVYSAFRLGYLVCQYFYGRHQVIYSVHTDTDNIEIHFCVNTVSFVDGSRLPDDSESQHALVAYAAGRYTQLRSEY